MTQAHDVWLVIASLATLFCLMSFVGALLERVYPVRAILLLCCTLYSGWRVLVLIEGPLTWYEPIEAAIRVYATIF
ncbi:MAG: hypothetical protein AAF198_05320 [Pseudomonadota bacterium]